MGNEHLKKILIFVLLMKRGYRKERLYEYLAGSHGFPVVVDRCFHGRYRRRYDRLIEDLLERNTIRIEDGIYHADVAR